LPKSGHLGHDSLTPIMHCLELGSRDVADAGLECVKSLRGLRPLRLSGLKVPETAKESLEAALPGLEVTD